MFWRSTYSTIGQIVKFFWNVLTDISIRRINRHQSTVSGVTIISVAHRASGNLPNTTATLATADVNLLHLIGSMLASCRTSNPFSLEVIPCIIFTKPPLPKIDMDFHFPFGDLGVGWGCKPFALASMLVPVYDHTPHGPKIILERSSISACYVNLQFQNKSFLAYQT